MAMGRWMKGVERLMGWGPLRPGFAVLLPLPPGEGGCEGRDRPADFSSDLLPLPLGEGGGEGRVRSAIH
ncbi:hypothetical protein ASE76_18035 [Xylophilus sp. Leaf220]|nr:hypothetical protein ASE76_18035 [Xylophilus sp. Leaf220]